VPVDYFANSGIDARLKHHFGLKQDDDEGLRQALGIDFREVSVPYIGPRLHDDLPDRDVDYWGIHRMWIAHPSGGYWDFVDFPLKDATLDEIAAWPMPSPDDFDYSQVETQCRKHGEYAVYVGNPGLADCINSTGFLRTMEQVLIDLITDDPAVLHYMDRKCAVQLAVTERILEAAKGGIDFVWMGEDLGTQHAPLISKKLYRKHIRPRHQPFVDLAKAYDLPVVLHSCGSSSWAYEDFIEMGITGVDTLQPEATDMSPRYLKDHFDGRLFFHGSISTAGPVAYGTVDDVIANCRETLGIMMPGGGYSFAPTHSLQDNSPTENVVAMYESAHQYGRY
jgi:uroporphyrinogen decarboxylase